MLRVSFVLLFVVAALLLFLFFRWKKINVVVKKIRPVKRQDGTDAFKYLCVDAQGREIGTTKSTELAADKGDVLQVAVPRLELDFDDNVVWPQAKVIKKVEEKPTDRKVLEKMAR